MSEWPYHCFVIQSWSALWMSSHVFAETLCHSSLHVALFYFSRMSRELEESRETVTCSVCVELFNDARILNCSHSFCMHCLIGCQAQAGQDGVTEIACPVCREVTVPPLADIPLLPVNVFANKVAILIRVNDEASNPQGSSGENGLSIISMVLTITSAVHVRLMTWTIMLDFN